MAAAIPFVPFRSEEFRLYEPQNRGEESLNDRRLAVRRKLQAIGEAAQKALAGDGVKLERRESLHHPFSMNHFRVVAQWTALFRDAKARKEFGSVVGAELGKDVDPGHANAALAVAIDDLGVEIGFRIGVEAWYDGQNFANRGASDAARRELIELLHAAPGFALRIHDWETRYPTETLNRDHLNELFKYYQPGTHRLTCLRAISKSDPAACDASLLDASVAALRALVPLYRFAAWSPENNQLLKAGGGGFVKR